MVGDFQVKSCYVSKVQPFNNWMLIKMAGSLGVFVRDADSSIYFVPVWYHFDWVVAVAFSVGDLLSEWKKQDFEPLIVFCLLVTCNQLISIVVDGSCQNMRSREAGSFNVGSSLISSFLCWAGFKGPASIPGSLIDSLKPGPWVSALAFAGIKRTPDKRGQGKENAEAVQEVSLQDCRR